MCVDYLEYSPSTVHAPKIPPIFLADTIWRHVVSKLMAIIPEDSKQAKPVVSNSIKDQYANIDLYRII